MGFIRWRYVKQEHLHCMVFRKIVKEEKEDNLISDITPDMLYIPQDFNDLDIDLVPNCGNESVLMKDDDNFFMSTSITELPMFASDLD